MRIGADTEAPEEVRKMAGQRRRRRRRRQAVRARLLLFALLIGAVFAFLRFKEGRERKAFAMEGIEALEQGDYENAIASFDRALLKSRGKTGSFEKEVLLYRAEAEDQTGDYAAALDTYERLLAGDGKNEAYRTGAALCLAESGDYERALELGSVPAYVYNRMAKSQIEAGEYEKASESVEAGLAAASSAGAEGMDDKEKAKKAKKRGGAFPSEEITDRAVRDLEYNRAVIAEFQGDYKKALALFEAYSAAHGTNERVEREIAFLRTRQGSKE